MITLPKTTEEARAAKGTVRAGGTDLQELRHKGIVEGPVVDLRDLAGADAIELGADGTARVGALVRLATLAEDPRIRAGWPGLADAAGGLATPQIRARATVGGALLQEVRCWYFRSAEFQCLKKGGATCFARAGDAVFHSAIDTGPCIAPHPSTLACALLAYDGKAEVDGALRDVPTLLGDGRDPRRTHAVAPGELLGAIVLPPPVPDERGAYLRAISRARAEWPLVEATVRVKLDGGAISSLVMAVGGIANRPIRYDEAGRAAVGLRPDDPKLDDLLQALASPPGATLPQAAYKLRLLPTTLRDALDRALETTP